MNKSLQDENRKILKRNPDILENEIDESEECTLEVSFISNSSVN